MHTLIGHEDWIRDIDVCQTNSQQLMIASSSQDNYIRLWKLESKNIVNNMNLLYFYEHSQMHNEQCHEIQLVV